MKVICIGCNRIPEEIEEYIEMAKFEEITPEEYVMLEEVTYNKKTGHFLCNDCYIKAGCPDTPYGWVAE